MCCTLFNGKVCTLLMKNCLYFAKNFNCQELCFCGSWRPNEFPSQRWKFIWGLLTKPVNKGADWLCCCICDWSGCFFCFFVQTTFSAAERLWIVRIWTCEQQLISIQFSFIRKDLICSLKRYSCIDLICTHMIVFVSVCVCMCSILSDINCFSFFHLICFYFVFLLPKCVKLISEW